MTQNPSIKMADGVLADLSATMKSLYENEVDVSKRMKVCLYESDTFGKPASQLFHLTILTFHSPNLSQFNPNLSQFNPNLSQLNPNPPHL